MRMAVLLNTENQYNDMALVSMLRQGDIVAFDAIYKKYIIVLLDIAYKRLGDKSLSEDLVQNVFMRLWHRRDQICIDNLTAYLHTSVRYEVLNHVTRNKALYGLNEPFELIMTASETADERILSRDILKLVVAFAETLPPKRKEVFLRYIRLQHSTGEIAQQMNISQKTVQKHLKIALNDFKTQIVPAIIALLATRL